MGYSLSQFEKDIEEIFSYIPHGEHEKVVMCCRCGDTVSASDGDCTCGYIGEIVRRIVRNSKTKEG